MKFLLNIAAVAHIERCRKDCAWWYVERKPLRERLRGAR